jgi:hypothetical protein
MPHEPERHAQHDPLLVVAFAAGDLAGTDLDRAAALVTDCPECRTLHDDLLSIAGATAALPAARRPRDFRLTDADAARLRPAGWRGLVAAFSGPRLAFTRQLGVGLTTLGIAGLLISIAPSVSLSMGSAGAAPAPTVMSIQTTEGSSAAPAAGAGDAASGASDRSANDTLLGASAAASAAPMAPAASQPAPSAAAGALEPKASRPIRDLTESYGNYAGASEPTSAGPEAALASRAGGAGESSTLLLGSIVALAVGIGLLLARRIARRIAAT